LAGAAYEVSNVPGAGFLETIYERALIEELRLRGLPVTAQAPFPVAYKGKHIGTYAADLVVGRSPAEGIGSQARLAHQLPPVQSGVATRRPQSPMD